MFKLCARGYWWWISVSGIFSGKSEKFYNEKVAEEETAFKADEYKRKRLEEYPSIQECIHAILDDDLEALQAKRTAVKAKYPKPE